MSLDTRAARAEINRLSRLMSDEEQTINALFQRIGQTYFIAHKEDPEDSQAGYIRGIFDAIERTKKYKEQINRVRGIAICPNCSAEVTITSAFCNRCGAKMPAADASYGGGPAYGASSYGAQGYGGRTPAPGPSPASAPGAAPAAYPSEPEPSEISCPSCGAICSTSQRFCNRCGGSLGSAQTAAPASGGKVCPNCGTELAEDSAFCLECGQPV